jgi:hypothetical protein
MTSEREAYVYIQLPGSLETVPAALLRVRTLPDGTQIGRFRYGNRYLARPDIVGDLVWAYPNGDIVVVPRLSADFTSPHFNFPDLFWQGTFKTFLPGGGKP